MAVALLLLYYQPLKDKENHNLLIAQLKTIVILGHDIKVENIKYKYSH